MPLPPHTERDLLHTRHIDCRGYRRSDGLWDIEGHLLDTREEAIQTYGRGRIEPGEPLHEMWMRLTVDDELHVIDLQASIEQAPYPACPYFPKERFTKLIGQQIAPGWTARVRLALGGVHGCTHLLEMLGPLATTAVQTVYAWRGESFDNEHHQPPEDFINSCHSLVEDGEAAKRLWPNRKPDDPA